MGGTVGRRQTIISSVLSCFGGGVFLIYLVEELAESLLGGHGGTETLHRTMSVRKSGRTSSTVDPHNDMEKPNYGSMNKGAELSQSEMTIRSSAESPDLLVTKSTDTSTSLREFFTILALSTHALFEGLAVGLEESTTDVWKLFTAIACHKFIIAFCVSMEMIEVKTKKFIFYSYLTVFSVTSAIGIAVGIIITEAGSGTVPEVVNATLQGIAAGTLLYVVMFEVLNRERERDISGILQLAGVIVGFGVMLTIECLAPHHEHGEHEHGEEGDEEHGGHFHDHHDHHDHGDHDHHHD